MISQLSHVMTLANSIIGVSVLAMPFCFKQCGIVLAVVVLLLSSILSRLACHFLVKSAVMSRRRNFELLAFHAFGHMGKLLVELFIIGFLVGTCIAFFVVMGDLGPQIMGKIMDKNPEDIRTSLLVATSAFIVLPLGLLRNIDSLSSICTATIIFYICLVVKIIAESTQHIFAGDWYEHVYYWRPAGILQCVPIFSMALFCQTQLFEIYETIPNVSLEKMNEVVKGALNICTAVYLCVGFFGYIAFCTQPFTGNILMSFEPSLSSEMIKMGFVFSVAFSFPLVIFPCRASLNSLLFRRVHTHEPSANYIPETRYRCLTFVIVGLALLIGILIPNIEFVLGLVGSTIGVMICLIFPAAFFISISSKNTNERLLAQGILFIGIWIMILGTYANLYALEESTNTRIPTTSKPLSQMNNLPLNLMKNDLHILPNVPDNPDVLPKAKEKIDPLPNEAPDKAPDVKVKDVRQEPPIPVERVVVTEKQAVDTQKSAENIAATFAPEIKKIVDEMENLGGNLNRGFNVVEKADAAKSEMLKEEKKPVDQEKKPEMPQRNDNLINPDAIKKEESELAADGENANAIVASRQEELKKTLKKHKLEQLQMIREQKEILKDIREQKQELERERQRMAKDAEELKRNEQKLQDDGRNSFQARIDDRNLKENKIEETKALESKDNEHIKQDSQAVKKDEDFKESVREERKIEDFKDAKNQNVQPDKADEPVPQKKETDIEASKHSVPEIQESNVLRKNLSDSPKILKDPILNVLTKGAFQNSISAEAAKKDDKLQQAEREARKGESFNLQENSKNEDRRQSQYSVPIALKMINQTNAENMPSNKTDKNVQALHRDILENHDREKREIEKAEANDTKAANDLSNEKVESLVSIADRENCYKKEEKDKEETKARNESTEASLIKTNAYLSDQGFTDAISIDSSIDTRDQYVKVKQRDLKALKMNDA